MRKILLLLISLVTIAAKATVSVWDGSSSSLTWYTSGSGGTYHISTAADLAGLAKCFPEDYYLYGNFSGKTIILDNDIDLGGYEWTPIGTLSSSAAFTSFAGIFDGNGHTIKGLHISKLRGSSYLCYAGLFGWNNFDASFTIKNLKVEGDITISSNGNLTSSGSAYIGGIAACSGGSIENCSSDVSINVTLTTGNDVYCGGIVGYMYNYDSSTKAVLTKCCSKGSIKAYLTNSNKPSVGGIAGNIANDHEVSLLESVSDIYATNGKISYLGGIIGQCSSSVNDAIFKGNISTEYANYALVGGIIGNSFSTCTLTNCIAIATLSKSNGTAYLSSISGTKSSSLSTDNCFYLFGMSNNTSYGSSMTESQLKSGEPISGFNTELWCFETGSYPYLGFSKPQYTMNIALEGGYLGMKMNEGASKKWIVTSEENNELYQILWGDYDITSQVTSEGVLQTPEITSDVVLRFIFKETENSIKKTTLNEVKFKANNNGLTISGLTGSEFIYVYTKSGLKVFSEKTSTNQISIPDLSRDVYIIKIGNESFKIAM